MPLLQRYVFRQLLFPTAASVFILAALLLLARLVKIVSLLLNRGLSFVEVSSLLALLLPSFLEFSLPMGVLVGAFLVLGRLTADGELTGMQACGVRPTTLILPLLFVSSAAALCTSTISLSLRPASRQATVKYLEHLSLKRASAALQEQVFFNQIPGIVIYAERIHDRGQVLQGVFLADQRTPGKRMTMVAKRGYIISHDGHDAATLLRLEDGILFSWKGRVDTYEVSHFETFDWNLSESIERASRNVEPQFDPKAANTRTLLTMLWQAKAGSGANTLALELSSRIALPFSCIVFVLLAWTLSTKWQLSSTAGIGISSLCFLVYYLLSGLAESVAPRFQHWLLAATGAWAPNGVLGLVTLALRPSGMRGSSPRIFGPTAAGSAIMGRLIARCQSKGERRTETLLHGSSRDHASPP